jgi:hypothetical protein
MGGTGKMINRDTGQPFDDIVGLIKTIPDLSESDMDQVFEGNARTCYPRAFPPSGTDQASTPVKD